MRKFLAGRRARVGGLEMRGLCGSGHITMVGEQMVRKGMWGMGGPLLILKKLLTGGRRRPPLSLLLRGGRKLLKYLASWVWSRGQVS